MSQLTIKKYPAEFKERAVKLAVESEQPLAQIARDLGINANTLYTSIPLSFTKSCSRGERHEDDPNWRHG